MRVQDWKENEIKVGSKVIYGAPSTPEEIARQRAEVIEISEPDVLYNPVTDADDGGYAVFVTVKFADGDTEKLRADFRSSDPEVEETFEASDDIEVIS